MTTIKVKFREPAHAESEGRIYYQVTHDRKVRQLLTDYKILGDEWDSKKSTIAGRVADAGRRLYLQSVSDRIRCDKERLRRIISELSSGGSYTSDEIVGEFEMHRDRQSLFAFMDGEVARLRQLGKHRTSQTYDSALRSLRRYTGGEDVAFDAFTPALMESYQAWLKGKGLVPNSISFYMRILRAVYNRAVEKGITDDRKPFVHVYTGVDRTTKRAVDVDTLKKIKQADLSMSPGAAYARDIFLLSFYLRGMSFVDMAFLKKTDLADGRVTYRRRKTGQKIEVKWTREMQRILDRYPRNDTEYLLPVVTSTAATPYSQYKARQYQINKGLKVVAGSIGLKMPLTLYCSRHSWASIARSRGIPVGVISDGLGHDSELTTRIYLSTLDTSAVDKANAMIMELL